MQGKDLSRIIDNVPALKSFCKGVYSINTMPKCLKKREFFFANLDLESGKGSHWICILKNDKNNIELFDSLGIDSIKLEWFLKYFKIKTKELLYNITSVQSQQSENCGLFTLYFVIKRLLNIDICFSKILNEIFSDDLESNEKNVLEFINTI